MLQKIRDLVTGWLAVVIVALLCIPFAFWGINYYFGQGSEPVIATVNDKEIKLTQFQRAFSNYRLQMRALLGDNQASFDDEFIKQQTIERLVESEILNEVTRSANLQISDKHVVGVIRGIEAFQTEDGFNRSFYELGVQRLGMAPAAYEAQLRLDMASEQLQSAIVESAFVLKEEAKSLLTLENQKRDFTYGIFSVEDIKDSIEVTDEEIKKYYDENKQNYQEPEQVKIAYLDLSLDKLAEDIDISEEMLLEYYTENKAKYDVAEQRKFNQALIKISEKATEGEIEEAKAKAEEINKLIDSGKTFKEIAEEHTEDTGPKLQVTEHGYTQKGVMSSEIDEVLFSMQVGEVSEMIRTKQGLHYIQSVDAKGEETNTFENSREEVDKDIRYQQAEEQFFDLSDQMATLAYEHPDTLDIAAEAIDIAVQESELFSRVSNKEGLLANSKIVSTSFSPEILGTGQNSEVLELSDTQLVVVRVIEHIPSSVKSLETVHDEILSDIRFLEAGRIQRESGQNILKQLQDGKTIEELETNLSIDWKQAEGASRTDVSVQRAILRSAFNLNKPTEDNPVYGGVTLGTGDYAVIVLTKVEDPEKIFEKDIDNKQLQLQQTRSGNDWDDFRQELRRRAEVQIFSDQI